MSSPESPSAVPASRRPFPVAVSACHGDCCDHAPAPEVPPPDRAADDAGAPRLLLHVPSMDCPVEEAQIRRLLEGHAGLGPLRFDLAARTLAVEALPASWPSVQATLQAAGFACEVLSAPPAAERAQARRRAEWGRVLAALALAGAAEALHALAPDTTGWRLGGQAVAVAAIGLSGAVVMRKGLAALRRGQLNIQALMAVAVCGAFAIGQWPEAAMVMALYTLAELIEARSVERARDAISGLLALSPEQAQVRQPDGLWAQRPAGEVAVGARVRVGPGERLPLDGRVCAGRSAVDQSPITGESLPVDKTVGDEVYAGTVNQGGALEFEVTKPAGDTVLARIIQAVEAAQGRRAPMQRFVDRFAAAYTPAIFGLACLVAGGGPLLLGWPALEALYKALVLLVIACPCALVISTPVTVVSGLAAAARRGILIKGGVFLEQARQLRTVALDKTGTLTTGRPVLVAAEAPDGGALDPALRQPAYSLAAASGHPVSRAIAQGLGEPLLPVTGLTAEPGRGVSGTVAGQALWLGNQRWIEALGLGSPALEARLRAHEALGRTVTLLADAQGVRAVLAVADTLRPESVQAVADLQALGVRTVLLTGDNEATARTVAAQAGIDDVQAGLLPQDKQVAVRALAAAGPVGMVGDGINDGPALGEATLGFAMGGAGTGTAVEAADVLIMNDDLRKVAETLRLSRRTHAVLWQNIALALGIKAVFLVLALFDGATLWMAVFADMGASLLVVFNGLRLLRLPPSS